MSDKPTMLLAINDNRLERNRNLIEIYNEIVNDLFKYEKHFYKTGKKSVFKLSNYTFNLSTTINTDVFIEPKIKLFSKYSNNPYYVKISELLDRLIDVKENFNIFDSCIIDLIHVNHRLSPIYYMRNTKLFMIIFQNLININFMEEVMRSDVIGEYTSTEDIVVYKYYLNVISNYINVYLHEIIGNSIDNKFINQEIEVIKKIIDNLHKLNRKNEIINTAEHLFYYIHQFRKDNKLSQIYFCNTLIKYICCNLNLLASVEFSDDLKFLEFDNDKQIKFIESIAHKYTFKPNERDNYGEPDGTYDIINI